MDAPPEAPKVRIPPWVLFLGAAAILFCVAHPALLRPHYYSFPSRPEPPIDPLRYFLMKVLVSIAFGTASLYVILSRKYQPKDKHWAYGIAGLIIGFWLR